jgi:glycosyltransferase involved in cell wall biosynthesis
MRTALIIPTLNEADSIGALLREVPRELIDRIIVADGGSTDLTAARAAAAGAHVLHAGHGYGRACLTGARAATDAEILVFMDGDGADDPRVIAALVTPIARGIQDFVLASRTLGNAAPGSLGWHQRGAGIVLGTAMRLAYGVRYTDMCAFRAIRRDLLLGFGMTEMTYGWNLEMQMRAARGGARILEVPVDNRRRSGGTSKVAGSVRGSLRAGTRILATFGRQLLAPKVRS